MSDLGGGKSTPPCFKCEQPMQRIYEGGYQLQPNDGLHFEATGAYGSTVFDPMDGSSLNIVICDDCITEMARKNPGIVMLDQKYIGVGFDPAIGDERRGSILASGFYVPDREPVEWDPDKDYGVQDPLWVEPEEVAEAKELHSTMMWKASAVKYAREWLEAEAKEEAKLDPDGGCCMHGHTRGEHPACFDEEGNAR